MAKAIAVNAKRSPLVDPHGMIANVRRRLSKQCAVALSPFCDSIIAMRMQGVPLRDIEKWLIEQGQESRIPASTIFRNLKNVKIDVKLPLAEEIAERWGGAIDIDMARELSGQVLIQRERIDKLVRRELDQQKTNLGYHDKRIHREQEMLVSLVAQLRQLVKDPDEALKERQRLDKERHEESMVLTPEALNVIRGLILSGQMLPKSLVVDANTDT